MKNIIKIVITILVVAFVAFAVVNNGDTTDTMTPKDTPVVINPIEDAPQEYIDDLATLFREKITTRATALFGVPIEGFDAFILKSIFAELQYEDFIGVETYEGHYEMQDGVLEFVRDQTDVITSAEKALSDKGYDMLLANLSVRLNIPLATADSLDRIISTLEGQPTIPAPTYTEYEDKVVYGIDGSLLDMSAIQIDCSERGGVFSECGSPCPSDADFCIEVCAFTCSIK